MSAIDRKAYGLDLRNCEHEFEVFNCGEEKEIHFQMGDCPDFMLELEVPVLYFFEDMPNEIWEYLGEDGEEQGRHEFLFRYAGEKV